MKPKILLSTLIFTLLLVTDVYAVEKKTLFIDMGITFGTKGPFGIVLAYKYAFADNIAVELFIAGFPGPDVPLLTFGSEVNYYPESLHDHGYFNLGISHVIGFHHLAHSTSFWSLNAGIGANTGELKYGFEDLPTVLYAELGLARILGINKTMGKEATKVDEFLWFSEGWYFPNIEAGLRVRQL